MDHPERRQHPRVDVDLPLRLTFENHTVETRIRNLSNSGIRFRAPAALPLLSRVQIALELPMSGSGSGGALAITGVVVRCEPSEGGTGPRGGDTIYDTAIYFEDLSDGARAQLSQFVSGYGS